MRLSGLPCPMNAAGMVAVVVESVMARFQRNQPAVHLGSRTAVQQYAEHRLGRGDRPMRRLLAAAVRHRQGGHPSGPSVRRARRLRRGLGRAGHRRSVRTGLGRCARRPTAVRGHHPPMECPATMLGGRRVLVPPYPRCGEGRNTEHRAVNCRADPRRHGLICTAKTEPQPCSGNSEG